MATTFRYYTMKNSVSARFLSTILFFMTKQVMFLLLAGKSIIIVVW
jgi:hypothetical protein